MKGWTRVGGEGRMGRLWCLCPAVLDNDDAAADVLRWRRATPSYSTRQAPALPPPPSCSCALACCLPLLNSHIQVKHLIRNLDAEESARAVEAAAAGAWLLPPPPRSVTLPAAKKQGKLEYQVAVPVALVWRMCFMSLRVYSTGTFRFCLAPSHPRLRSCISFGI